MSEVTRRTVLKNLALGGAALATAPSLKASVNLRKQGRPNVLLLVSDQERSWMDLPGGLDLPAHEKLLNRGTGFNQYYVNTSPCSPSRSVMYSGQHTMRTGMTANLHAPPFPSFNQELPTLGHFFQNLGYHTAHHMLPGLHWSQLPALHDKIRHRIPEHLITDNILLQWEPARQQREGLPS